MGPGDICSLGWISVAEIRFGIGRETSPSFRAELAAWPRDRLLPWLGDRILEVGDRVLLRWRRPVLDGQKSSYSYSQPDALLAATALVHELGVVTRNTADFQRADLRLFNPWEHVI